MYIGRSSFAAGAFGLLALFGLAACSPSAAAVPTAVPAAAAATVPVPVTGPTTAAPAQSGYGPAATPTTSAAGPTTAGSGRYGYGPAAAPTTSTAGMPANAAVKVARVQGFGLFLTDNADMTLYANSNDTKDTVTCTGGCAANWPAFIASSTPTAPSNLDASLLTTFTRADGKSQVEYDGHPLYYFIGDKNPGDVKGQGLANIWHVLSPRGNPMMNAYTPGPTATPAQ